ncbi:D-alanyl-D-alanine carboxypeptidase family protein [Paenibacillus sp. KQZ6P-2]|uniref:D-alanyl-D-alanine carboxypeptidase family protein n=1 Tax=Paenibacillus mangrovi TaxID=2931978 RepID=A0A9X2B669_9BACL|nr:M15 family metallopeptidase [Paenibacillus mangrovi]MCJ8012393.1 D-alanyl-D-alanine carboxypeptidase family protein [Paenibacillus mangrovi]
MRKYVVTSIVAVIMVGGAIWAWDKNRTPAAEGAVVEKTPALTQQKSNQEKEAVSVKDNASETAKKDHDAESEDTKSETGKNDEPAAQKVEKPTSEKTNSTKNTDAKATAKKPEKSDTASHPATGSKTNNEASSKKSSKTGGNAEFVNTYSVEHVVANPESVDVLVNKTYRLPSGYVPPDLVYPNVPFTFSEKVDKRKMRKDAAIALEEMFEAAEEDGISLAGVSGYRSESRQTTLYNNYVKKDGVNAADTYSARPGHSEHQTGLTIDVSGSSGKCAAESCFAGTKEAKWLAKHASEYGFIIRYPEGKESITGYKYEPWHLRYVGTKIAQEVTSRSITLEQYFGKAVPVSK